MSINLNCPINLTGYGVASFNILKELLNIENIALFPIGQPSVQNKSDYDLISSLLSNQQYIDRKAPCVKIWHQFDLATRIGCGKYFAYPFFELDTFNAYEKMHLAIPDELITSCQWSKDVLIDNGIKSTINIVPLGVDNKIFNPSISRIDYNNDYVFLTIGKWEIRKSHELLPELFKKAFPSQKDVKLIIVASEHSSYSNKEEIQSWKNLYSNDERIKVIPGVNSQSDLAQIIANSDCGIYISKAEGWNLELLETMAMNKPTIATNYSAHTEFCNSNNCFLVDIEEKEKAHDGKAFHGQGYWAKIGDKQIEQTIEHMRYLYNNRIITNEYGVKTAKQYTWANSAKILSGCINK
jgi:glycosyltransferase involved in cell wall biosynthesis